MFEPAERVAIKVCGVTRRDDALGCAESGVEMIGLNFAPQSARCLAPAGAEEIVSAMRAQFPETQLIGVFVDQDRAFVREMAGRFGLDGVQLHGAETPEYASDLADLFVIKAFRVGASFAAAEAVGYPAAALLFDSWKAGVPGGTGETFPWAIAAGLRSQVRRLFLAGGLTSANVAEAIRQVQPDAVDVCSGVEMTPGEKDLGAVRHFVAIVRGAA